jgi:hypothetical protein
MPGATTVRGMLPQFTYIPGLAVIAVTVLIVVAIATAKVMRK